MDQVIPNTERCSGIRGELTGDLERQRLASKCQFRRNVWKKVLWEGCAWGVDIAKPQSIARFLPYVVVENDRDQALKSNKVSQPLQSTH